MRKIGILLLSVVILGLCVGCSADDPFEDMWTQNIYPSLDATYDIGSNASAYDDGYFTNLWVSQNVSATYFIGNGSQLTGISSGGGGDYIIQRFQSSGRYHSASVYRSAYGGVTLTENYIYAVPYLTGKSITVTRMAIQVRTTAAGANCRIGIYADDGSTHPSALVLDAGEIDCNSGTGIKEITGLSTVLDASSLYWLVILTNSSAWDTTLDSASTMPNIIGWSTTTLNTNGVSMLKNKNTYGTLPVTYPTSSTYYETSDVPRICIYW